MDTVIVEVIVKNSSSINSNKVLDVCEHFLKEQRVAAGTVISDFKNNLFLFETISHMIIGEYTGKLASTYINFPQVIIKWCVYTLHKNGQQIESEIDDDGNDVELAIINLLPAVEFVNLWENLIYDFGIKEDLICYAETAMLFADRNVDINVVSCNRVVLLHGPPGTGKTSLCKALAQKLTVRLRNKFKRGYLLEINSHSLFSKWFSESGKLVTKMFSKITEYIKDSDAIIFVLVDEIESLAYAREKCMSGVEPTDSIRVVNAILTQIDKIKNNSNVLILTTSNLTGAIDMAFVDRADITQYIGLPGPEAIYQIYYSCIEELLKADIITPKIAIPSVHIMLQNTHNEIESCKALCKISQASVGFSGRTLRKIPFLAHSLFVKTETVDINTFFDAMILAINRLKNDKEYFKCIK